MLTILIFYINSVLLIKLKYKDKFKKTNKLTFHTTDAFTFYPIHKRTSYKKTVLYHEVKLLNKLPEQLKINCTLTSSYVDVDIV